MAQFEITRSPGDMDLMLALFDRNHLHTVKFTVQGVRFGNPKPRHDAMSAAEDKIRREIFDEDIPPHEIEVKVTGLTHGVTPAAWVLDGKTVEESPQPIRCFFSSIRRDGEALIGDDAETNRLWYAQRPCFW
jgi:hypothetical protein